MPGGSRITRRGLGHVAPTLQPRPANMHQSEDKNPQNQKKSNSFCSRFILSEPIWSLCTILPNMATVPFRHRTAPHLASSASVDPPRPPLVAPPTTASAAGSRGRDWDRRPGCVTGLFRPVQHAVSSCVLPLFLRSCPCGAKCTSAS